MDKKLKQYLFIGAALVALFAIFMNFGTVLGFLGDFISLVLPIIAGTILALFINVPVNAFERWLTKLFSHFKRRPSAKAIRAISFVITLICIALVIFFVMTLLIPEVIASSKSLYKQIEERIKYIKGLETTNEWVDKYLSKINLDSVIKGITSSADVLVTNVVGVVSSTVNIVVTAAFGIIISIYITLSKDKICRNLKAITRAYLKPKHSDFLIRFSRMFSESFSKFLSGQCAEAVILGVLMFLAFTVFRLPYGLLVGVLTTVCALIPYIGAFISCAISVFLILIIDPTLAIRCIIVYLVVQFVENQLIYPRVVGSSVGLSPFYTLLAALIGGKLFGILGIIFFIPLTAVILELIKEDADKRLDAQGAQN